MKIRITEFAKQEGMDIEQVFKLRDTRLQPEHWTGTGKNTYFTEAAQDLLRMAIDVPLAVPAIIKGTVLHEAANNRWVYTKLHDRDGKHPVAIPRKLRGSLVGKVIPVQVVVDAQGGTTYRHASLAG